MVRCQAIRWVDDEPQPGLVEVTLTDVQDRTWTLIDKAPVFDGSEALRPEADYPISVSVACTVLERRTDRLERQTAVIDLSPWSLTDQVFEVLAEQLTTECT